MEREMVELSSNNLNGNCERVAPVDIVDEHLHLLYASVVPRDGSPSALNSLSLSVFRRIYLPLQHSVF